VFRRLERETGAISAASETEGTFSFVGGSLAVSLERIRTSTSTLLMEGSYLRQLVELSAYSRGCARLSRRSWPSAPTSPDMPEAAARVLEALTTPRTLSELLTKSRCQDLAVDEAWPDCSNQGLVRRIASSAVRIGWPTPSALRCWRRWQAGPCAAGYRGAAPGSWSRPPCNVSSR
jgi:hypothetical protein